MNANYAVDSFSTYCTVLLNSSKLHRCCILLLAIIDASCVVRQIEESGLVTFVPLSEIGVFRVFENIRFRVNSIMDLSWKLTRHDTSRNSPSELKTQPEPQQWNLNTGDDKCPNMGRRSCIFGSRVFISTALFSTTLTWKRGSSRQSSFPQSKFALDTFDFWSVRGELVRFCHTRCAQSDPIVLFERFANVHQRRFYRPSLLEVLEASSSVYTTRAHTFCNN